MDKKMAFAVHCIELYRKVHKMDGNGVMDVFIDTGALDYVLRFHDALHVMGDRYILDDLESFIAERQGSSESSPQYLV